LREERKRGILFFIQSIKHQFISKFPNYLIISINRFEYDIVEKKNKKNKSKIIINPFLKIENTEYEIYSIIIHTVNLPLFRDLLPMQATTLPSLRLNIKVIANGFAIMTRKSANFKLLEKLIISYKIANKILLTSYSMKIGSTLKR
jgi:hypothetical protein